MHHLLKRRFHLDAKSNMQHCTKYCSTGGAHHQQAEYGQQEGYHQQVETSYLHIYSIGIQCIYSHPRHDIIRSLIHGTLTGWTLQLAKVFRVHAYSNNKDKDAATCKSVPCSCLFKQQGQSQGQSQRQRQGQRQGQRQLQILGGTKQDKTRGCAERSSALSSLTIHLSVCRCSMHACAHMLGVIVR